MLECLGVHVADLSWRGIPRLAHLGKGRSIRAQDQVVGVERGGAAPGPLGTIPARLDFPRSNFKLDIGSRLVIEFLDEIAEDWVTGNEGCGVGGCVSALYPQSHLHYQSAFSFIRQSIQTTSASQINSLARRIRLNFPPAGPAAINQFRCIADETNIVSQFHFGLRLVRDTRSRFIFGIRANADGQSMAQRIKRRAFNVVSIQVQVRKVIDYNADAGGPDWMDEAIRRLTDVQCHLCRCTRDTHLWCLRRAFDFWSPSKPCLSPSV
mmetsp:Transcript_5419/g.12333  ORF Transcript_5419/g.12333 Transcript_5419/m.12333 type:complete len:266 (+) Transcript_5419:500-1297(+)